MLACRKFVALDMACDVVGDLLCERKFCMKNRGWRYLRRSIERHEALMPLGTTLICLLIVSMKSCPMITRILTRADWNQIQRNPVKVIL